MNDPAPAIPWLRMLTGIESQSRIPVLAESVDWHRELEWLRFHDLGAAVVSLTRSWGDQMPDFFVRAILEDHERAIVSYELYRGLCMELTGTLCVDQPAVLLQGMAIIEHYPDRAGRAMADIDILVRDTVHATEVLRLSGWGQYENYSHVFVRQGALLDLHGDPWGCDRTGGRARIAPGAPAGYQASQSLPGWLVPDRQTLILQSAFHGLKHGFASKKWLLDLGLIWDTGICPQDPASVRILDATRYFMHRNGLKVNGCEEPGPARSTHLFKAVAPIAHRPAMAELLLASLAPSLLSALAYLATSLFPGHAAMKNMYGEGKTVQLVGKRLLHLLSYLFGRAQWSRN